MYNHITLIQKIHQRLNKQLNQLEVLLSTREKRNLWKTLLITRQLEQTCELQAEILAEIACHIESSHWIVVTVIEVAQQRVFTASNTLETFRSGLQRQVIASTPAGESASKSTSAINEPDYLFLDLGSIRLDLQISITMIVRMLELLSDLLTATPTTTSEAPWLTLLD